MALPKWIMQTRMASIIIPPGGLGGGAANYQLPFSVETQQQSNWCWAAVSTSVALYQAPGSGWQQCKVASQELGLTCCTNPTPGTCNVTWNLEKALTRVGHLNTWESGFLDGAEIRQELANNHPVGCRIGWFLGGGHFVAVSGIKSNGPDDDVTVEDPFFGRSVMPLTAFQTNYRNGGWTHSYNTN